MNVTHSEFRKALGCFSTGVTVITVDEGGEVHGMTANAFSSVSLDPPLVLVCVGHQARTHAHLQAKKRFGVNVLAADQRGVGDLPFQLGGEFLGRSDRWPGWIDVDRFADLDHGASSPPG